MEARLDDEFDSDKLDESKWDVPPDGKRRDGWWMRKAIQLDGNGHLAIQPGHWSAFWLMGHGVNKIGNEGRDGTEIDIMERPWLDDRVQHALHWDGYGKEHSSKGKVAKLPGVMQEFHTFALWWKPDEYIFYVDGKETWRTTAGGVCQVPLYITFINESSPVK